MTKASFLPFGTGQRILEAVNCGAEKIVLAIGGSATNDGGAGMLKALGVRCLDAQGSDLEGGGLTMTELAYVDLESLDSRLRSVRFEVAADVDNPLYGDHGASSTFAPQKGGQP